MGNLYQKYRPASFDDIVGQDAVVTILRNSILLDKVSHGYFFQGPRGTGKTSAARVFAKSINCEDRDGANVCGACTPCLKGHLDLVEIDGGSTRGIEDIKKLREQLRYRPRYCSKKVVIIDECHQLTTDGINALLKIAEEPPKHVIFILCTTDPLVASETKHAQALLTLISRLMVLPFKAHSIGSISKKLAQIYENETGTLPESQDIQDGLSLMARRAKGSLRDAENFLEIFLTTYYENNQDLSPVAMDWLFPPEEEKALQLIERLCEVNPLSAMPIEAEPCPTFLECNIIFRCDHWSVCASMMMDPIVYGIDLRQHLPAYLTHVSVFRLFQHGGVT